jgi:hypothetical protein
MDTPQSLITSILADSTALAKLLIQIPPSGNAYPKAITDRVVRTKPPLPSLGPAGYLFADPVFKSEILRVTDEKTGGATGTSWRTPSLGRAWAEDSKTFVLTSTRGGCRSFNLDPAGMRVVRLLDSPLETEPWFGDSGMLAYGRVSRNIGKANPTATVAAWDALTGQVTNLVELHALAPWADLLTNRTYARDISVHNGILLALFGGQSQDDDHLVCWAPLVAGGLELVGGSMVLDTMNDERLPHTKLHAATFDLTGRYVWLSPTGADLARDPTIAAAYLWDTTAGTIVPITMENGGHGAVGFAASVNCPDDSDGSETLVREYATLNSVRNVIAPTPLPLNFQISNHLSWWNAQPDRLMPVLIANYRYYGDNRIAWREWDDEVVAVETRPGPTTVYRFCHHRSAIGHDITPVTALGYWYLPKPQVSPDGKWCLFTSNWEKTLGPDPEAAAWEGNSFRQDTFLVALR